ncbi:MAG: hypothetical protein OXD45_02840 [Rhodobacteraceae bacterium]|nr:hypothetical protein [Paracoccaceae bacterium]
MRFLVESGADVDFRSGGTGTTSLMAAAARNIPAMARLLLELGADPTLRSYSDGPDPELADMSSRDFAVKYSGPGMVETLLIQLSWSMPASHARDAWSPATNVFPIWRCVISATVTAGVRSGS